MAEKDERLDNQKTAFSEDELAGLSEAERAALEEKDDTEALRTIAGEGGGDDDDDDADAKAAAERKAAEEKAAAEAKAKEDAEAKAAAEAQKKRDAELAAMSEEDRKKAEAADKAAADKAAADDAAKAKADADAKAKADADAKARADADVDEPLIPTYRAEPPENYDAKVKDLDERKAAATAKFKANEMEVEDMLAAHNEIDAERRKLDEQKLKAEISAEQQEQASQQRWQWEVNRFMRNVAKHEDIDYKANNMLNAALDAEVKRLANDEANKDKSGEWFLETAHESLKTSLGLKPKPSGDDKGAKDAAAREKADKEAKEKAEAERRKQADANRDKLHKGLGGLPAAGGGGELGGEGEFAHLDGLNGMELEYAVAKLTPEQQDRYSRAS